MNHVLPLMVGIPLGMTVINLLLTKANKRIADVIAPLTVLVTALMSFYLLGSAKAAYWMGGWYPPFGITLVYDGLSAMLLIIVNTVAFLSIFYSISYMEKYTAKPKFYSLFLLMLAGMNGVVITGDLFNLFVFLEIASIASYALVGFGVEHKELEASFKYLILGSIASTMILLGIALTYAMTGTVNMADAAIMLQSIPASKAMSFAAGVFIMGFALKSGLVPFHAWLPDAHPSAPAPVSAMLSGVLIKAIGVYAMLRVIFNVLGPTPINLEIMVVLGSLSMAVGGFLALGQFDIKRMLAYSSISQIGYIVMAFGLGTHLGFVAGLFHMVNHSAFKSLLFLSSGSIEHATGTKDLRKLGGLSSKLPITTTSTLVGALSISGVPPFNGFFSKLLIIIACVSAGRWFLAALAAAVSVITLIYFLKAMRFSLFGELSKKMQNIREVPFPMAFSLIALSVICLGIGIAYFIGPTFNDLFLEPAAAVLLDGLKNNAANYISTVLGG
ncbi:monovalent cation/H+ antiporter subunit D family protein [bacterium]|nr:monovalent cation/H+ antiporter subunit D family protein [bacterium]